MGENIHPGVTLSDSASGLYSYAGSGVVESGGMKLPEATVNVPASLSQAPFKTRESAAGSNGFTFTLIELVSVSFPVRPLTVKDGWQIVSIFCESVNSTVTLELAQGTEDDWEI